MTKNTPTAPLNPLPADAAKIVAFPQHAIKAAKRPVTIESIIEGAAGMASKQLIALVSAAFPNATVGEVRDALKAYSADRLVERKRLLAEEHLDLRLFDLCELVMAAGRADTVGEALRVLADEGNAEAATYLAQIENPEQDAFWRDFALAVEMDPYWTIYPDHSFSCEPGSRYSTAEELVKAYRWT